MLFDKKLWEDNGVETIEYENHLWLNERNLGKSAYYFEIRYLSVKYDDEYIKQRKEINKNWNRKFIREYLAVYLLLHINRVPSVIKCRLN